MTAVAAEAMVAAVAAVGDATTPRANDFGGRRNNRPRFVPSVFFRSYLLFFIT